MRKIIILLVVLVFGIAGLTYFYFSRLNSENDKNDTALLVATNQASIIFTFQNDKSFYQITESQTLLQQLLGIDKMALLMNFKKAIVDNDLYNSFINDQPVYLSVLPDEKKDINFLFTAQIETHKKIENFKSKLKNPLTQANEIYDLKLSDSVEVYIGFKNNVVTASSSLQLVKNALKDPKRNDFADYIKANNQYKKTVLATTYLNFNEAPALLKIILAGNINGELNFLNKQNSYAVLNYNFSKEKILFNGNTDIKSADNYLKLFENISPQVISITNILPKNSANYVLYAFADYSNWHKKLKNWFVEKNENEKIEKNISNIQNQYRVNLNTIFPQYAKNQFILFQLSTGEKLGAISLSNGDKVKQLLLDISNNYNDDIKAFKTDGILYSYFGEPFKKFNKPFYTIVDNNLVVANNPSTLQSFLNDYKNSRFLIQSAEYLDALNQISTTANVSFYINLKNSDGIFRNAVQNSFYRNLSKEASLKSFDTFYYQMAADKNRFMTNMLLNKYVKPQIPDTLTNRL
ncbi:hypothetical protein EZJ43_10925 [Pedobacter changchengzhani]|uniref:DUF3352 domain-containing protein n=1 Tax=Pedobacter changchengzhani TaxID=2529274 RepID=A0A4R5MJS8_9SPHI|nr:hypothetical protein [Pedobacter changchengzhani]TDG35861.1 hypothetical protein EZJ43_10925 [Pedobacter changchengzhani]